MATFNYWTLPMPVSTLSPISLTGIMNASFGSVPTQWSEAWVTYIGASELATDQLKYWYPSLPIPDTWSVNGTDIGAGFNHQAHVLKANFSSAVYQQGTDIAPYAFLTVPESGSSGSYTVCQTPLNEEGGFWRIAYREILSSSAHPDWHTLLQPGDVVRMHFKPGVDGSVDGNIHTKTILAINQDGSFVVYDNDYYQQPVMGPFGTIIQQGGYGTGIHTVRYDNDTILNDTTIYRLTTDNLYLETGDNLGDIIPATIFNDKEVGGTGNDTLSGGLGDDVFQDAGGTNTIDGGGGFNLLKVGDFSSRNTFTHNPDGSWTLIGPGGTEIIKNVEVVQFYDQTIALQQRARSDFDGDGKSDLLWQYKGGQVFDWSMNGAQATSSAQVTSLPKADWSLLSTGDFNGDGRADQLWQYKTGQVFDWSMDTSTAISSTQVASLPKADWALLDAADFNGDGKTDLLWQYKNGQIFDWTMNGSQIASVDQVTSLPQTDWSLLSTGDFNGDGKSDMLWQYQDGQIFDWTMYGATITSATKVTSLPQADWSLLDTGDFNGDGKSDLLWQYKDGRLYDWTMNGAQISSVNQVTTLPKTDWSLLDTGDFNGDGKADLMWQYKDGQVFDWTMNGAQVTSASQVTSLPKADWSLIGS